MAGATVTPLSHSIRALGFKEYPFSVSADPRWLYLAPAFQAALDAVQRVITYRQGLAVVEGELGLGKSTLARRVFTLYETGGDDYLPAYIHTANYKSAYDVLADIASKFDLPPRRSEVAHCKDLEEWLLAQRAAGHTPIIIIDDAQLIRPAALPAFQYIYNFDVSDKLMQVILFGQSELRTLLTHSPALLSRVVAWRTVSPLEVGETLAMVNFRCQVAGRAEPIFDDAAIMKLYEATAGNPRAIVLVCQEVLAVLEGSASRRAVADAEAVEEAIARYRNRPDYTPPVVTPFTVPTGRPRRGRPPKVGTRSDGRR